MYSSTIFYIVIHKYVRDILVNFIIKERKKEREILLNNYK